MGEEQGVYNLPSRVGRDLGACRAGLELLAAATFEALAWSCFIFPCQGALDKVTWAYKGWGLGKSGSGD